MDGLVFDLGLGEKIAEGFFEGKILFFFVPVLDYGLQGFGFEVKTVKVDFIPNSNSFRLIF